MDQGFKHPSLSLTLNDFEKPQPSEPKKTSPLTLFDDLLDNPETANQLPNTTTNNNLLNQCQRGVMPVSAPARKVSVKKYELIRRKLDSSLSLCGLNAEINSIIRIGYVSAAGQSKLDSFNVNLEGVKIMCGGDANVKRGWYGASKGEINGTLVSGFNYPQNHGVYLSASAHPVESLQSSPSDEDGVRHMLICRVILGRVEVVDPFSGQNNPSSDSFHSGVDKLMHPKKYIIWAANMNTHILPEFLVSFRSYSHVTGVLNILEPYPISMPVAAMINSLSFSLPAQSLLSVVNYYDDYMERRLSTVEFTERLREILGDRLLNVLLQSYTQNVRMDTEKERLASKPKNC
ncbi:probable inactive poly [ADP-ribose] polymerase sro5 [Phtheirospermum japonicum]|uniref:Probable inactive poly [ADP-ribose] polymerase sro5 n=1 Tax=Phtheirospermum japonicum TaxID=374723 RepID=A0A830BZQ5_9LAMI|nr:probable inactive poly [ADP-ribose] polymerase sro5 [Phtheirospermum japonicum]